MGSVDRSGGGVVQLQYYPSARGRLGWEGTTPLPEVRAPVREGTTPLPELTAPSADPDGRYRVLVIHTTAVVLGLATWFSATAVSGQLKERWGIGDTASSLLTSSVNIGAVLLGVHRGCRVERSDCGSCQFSLISTWFKYGRGVALGAVIGGLALGSSLPHLIVGAGGVGDRWRIVTYSTSVLALASGAIVLSFVPTGPFPFSKAKFSLKTLPRIVRNRGVVLATLGYCTHMWELYGLWTWFLSLYTDYLEEQEKAGLGGRTDELSRKRLASLVTFGMVGIGGVGCLFIGWIADAKIGRCYASILSLAVSGACAAAFGPLSGAGAPQGLLIPLALLWGSSAVAESAQFSAMAVELSDSDTVGTALTLQMALGFSVTVAGIFTIPLVEEATSWAWTTVFLVPGPLLGIVLIAALKVSPDAVKMSNGKGVDVRAYLCSPYAAPQPTVSPLGSDDRIPDDAHSARAASSAAAELELGKLLGVQDKILGNDDHLLCHFTQLQLGGGAAHGRREVGVVGDAIVAAKRGDGRLRGGVRGAEARTSTPSVQRRSKAKARPSAHPTSHRVSAFSLIMMKPLTVGASADGSGASSGTGADRGKAVVAGVQVGTSKDGQTGAGVLSTRVTGEFAGRAVGRAAMGWAVGAPGRRSGEVLLERRQAENESTENVEEQTQQQSHEDS
eukprot:g10449.t2